MIYIEFVCIIMTWSTLYLSMQGYIYCFDRSFALTWSHLDVWHSHCQCEYHCICMAFHHLQFTPGMVGTYHKIYHQMCSAVHNKHTIVSMTNLSSNKRNNHINGAFFRVLSYLCSMSSEAIRYVIVCTPYNIIYENTNYLA